MICFVLPLGLALIETCTLEEASLCMMKIFELLSLLSKPYRIDYRCAFRKAGILKNFASFLNQKDSFESFP